VGFFEGTRKRLEEEMTEANLTDNAEREWTHAACPVPLDVDPNSKSAWLCSIQEMLETTLKRALAEVAVRPTSAPGLGPTDSGPCSPKKTGIDLSSIEKLKAADLRVALLIGKVPETSGLLIDTKTLAKLLAISKAHLYRLQATEALLAPIQVGHVKRWRLAEVLEWIEAGCPPQRVWSYKKPDRFNRKGR
jgi:predicted DNA-binding transcriptional regulator AlpA